MKHRGNKYTGTIVNVIESKVIRTVVENDALSIKFLF